jgi:hypothetical protein
VDVDEAADRLRQLLANAGFDPDRPDPAVAWSGFKRFTAEPVDVQTTELWFEAGDGDLSTDSPAYFDCVRMFMHYPDEGAEWGEQITAHFTAPPSVHLRLGRGAVHAEVVTDLPAWFRAVEASSAPAGSSRFVSMGVDPDAELGRYAAWPGGVPWNCNSASPASKAAKTPHPNRR